MFDSHRATWRMLWVLDPARRTPRLFTINKACGDKGGDKEPVWSPDGKRIAFVSDRLPTDKFDTNDDIFVVGSDGRGLHALTTDLVQDAWPAWSPDGAHVAFEKFKVGTVDANGTAHGCANVGFIEVVDLHGHVTKRVRLPKGAPGGPLAWSPDGASILVAVGAPDSCNYDLAIVSLREPRIRWLTRTPERDETSPAYSPDGTQIVYGCGAAFAGDNVCVMNNDGTGKRQLARSGSDDPEPTSSPDGSKILYVRQSTQSYLDWIWIMNADGTHQRPLIPDAAWEWDENPSWRP